MNLARLRERFQAAAEGYEKVEQAIAVEQLASLGAMLKAVLIIVRFYQQLASALAQAHVLPYLTDLQRMMSNRLEQLCKARLH